MLEPLLLLPAAAVGPDLDVSSSKALADSLDRVMGDDPYFNKLIRILATRCMTQAVYFCSGDLMPPEFHHYGLASPLYTHFTSPIRRYTAVIVHRLLAAALGIYKLPPIFQDRPQLTSISDSKNLLCYASYINGQKKIRASWNITRRKGRGLVRRRRALEGQEDGWKHQLQMVRIHMEVVEPQPTIELPRQLSRREVFLDGVSSFCSHKDTNVYHQPIYVQSTINLCVLFIGLLLGDITCLATVPIDMKVEAHFFVKEDDITTRISLAEMIFNEVDPSLEVECFKKDGDSGPPLKMHLKLSPRLPKRGDILIDINDRFLSGFPVRYIFKEKID
ncbi:hypothetical protein IFM89_033485 [Coptis chinensis]|uniref:RNB domain-containing protein n=1 Tax=Coptis chinensis TaxID=261450 RepID=A0A835HZK9_9MAGN|nr:hypothetical protein IFM89_033485 [Coptis chinensis]